MTSDHDSSGVQSTVARGSFLLHALATYGEPPEQAVRNRQVWESHLFDAAADGVGMVSQTTAALRSAVSHMAWRLQHSTTTAVPTGVLVSIAGLFALAFAFLAESPFPPRLHVHLAASLLLAGAVCLCHPRRLPRWGVRAVGLGVGSAMLHGLAGTSFQAAADVWLFVGAVTVATGCAAIVAWSVRPSMPTLRWQGFNGMALGTALIGVGNMTRYSETGGGAYGGSTVASAAALLLLANALMRLRRVV